MNKKINKIAICLSTLLMAANVAIVSASDFGYCTSVLDRDYTFRAGTTEKQGMAIRLGSEKLSMLKGCTISSVSAAFGSKRMTGGVVNLFIATSPDAEPLVSQEVAVSSAVKWLEFNLDNPYTITGDEPCLYIGYTGEISANSTMLMSDFTVSTQGCSFVFKEGEWIDLAELGYGNASLRVGIADAPSITDLMIKPLNVDGYFKAGDDYSMTGQLFNFGNETVTSFDLLVEVGGADAVNTTVSDIAIKPGETYDFTLPDWRSENEGSVALSIQTKNVNGVNDADPSDNLFVRDIFCYPANMERAILLEGFTGQACSNCPSGHAVISQFMENATETPVIEVMHHSGYAPDFFTMDADLDYTYFYGSTSTYAPAVMLNRTTAVGSVPVMNATVDNLNDAYAVVNNRQPYASLSLESTFDAETREVNISFSTYTHADMPSEQNVINVMLIQDNLVSKQSPYGDGYIHNAVFRGALTGNSWGVLLDEEAACMGGSSTWEHSFILPEEIFSDYYDADDLNDEERANRTWGVVPEDMYLVAYVAGFGKTPSSHAIYNAIAVPLGESATQDAFTTSVRSLASDASPRVMLRDGRVVVDGEYDSLRIFTLDGRSVNTTAPLRGGVYLVRISSKINVNTLKISVK